MTFHIRQVENARDRARFATLPHNLYSDDPNFPPPLLIERKQQLSPNQPFFKHAEWQAWLAFDGERPIGRISAQIDHLNESQNRPGLGYFGMLEAIDDPSLFARLLETAASWLRARGKTSVEGPFNLGINQEVGLLVEGFDTPPYFMMGHARPYYARHIEAAGYVKAQDMLAYEIAPGFEAPRIMRAALARLAGRMTVRPIDRHHTEDELMVLCAIFNDAWANNWGFVPFTEAEFLRIGREMLMIIPPTFIQIAEVDGSPAAFIVMLPNVNEAIADLGGRLLPFGWAKLLWRLKVRYPHTARVPLMGVKQAYQHTLMGPGLAFAVMDALRMQAVAKGIDRVEMSWILEDNTGMRSILEAIGGHVSKRYRVFEKTL